MPKKSIAQRVLESQGNYALNSNALDNSIDACREAYTSLKLVRNNFEEDNMNSAYNNLHEAVMYLEQALQEAKNASGRA